MQTMSEDYTTSSQMTVEIVDSMGDDMSPVRAARVSTGTNVGNNPQRDLGLLRYLIRENHTVPFETQIVTFYIEAPIFVTRQMLKHRISSISEESGRYRELEGKFYVPGPQRKVVQVGKTGDYEFVESDSELNYDAAVQIANASEDSWERYKHLLRIGVAKEVARMVLPVNLYSHLYMTMNSRSIMNFLFLRLSDFGSHPQYEIEQVANTMYESWRALYPETARAWTAKMREDS